MMGMHKLTAGDGYTYLTRQVAAADATHKGRTSLRDYYSEKGETPGHWLGRGLGSLGVAGLAGRTESPDAAVPAAVKAARDEQVRAAAERAAGLWAVEPGSEVTEDQMRALYGLGLHPNAAALTDALINADVGKASASAAVKLGRPFQINPGETELQRRLAIAFRDHNLSQGQHWNAAIDKELRARLRTEISTELFAEEHGRPPADDRELGGFIARNSRVLTTSVAGYDFTFSPIKSFSVLWALAPRPIAELLEKCHHDAVSDSVRWLEDNASFTRTGAQGVAQVDTEGFIAAAFTHRDSRAGDPDLHTHVAVSNKCSAVGADGVRRWLALDGRPLHKSVVAASEFYNTRLEAYLADTLGLRCAARGDAAEGKREIREIVGVPTELITGFSSRRAAIDTRVAELSKQFQRDHGREPTTPEAIALAQQATLETRTAKHEPRSLGEQRQQWRTQAIGALGSDAAVDTVIANALAHGAQQRAAADEDWVSDQAAGIIATLTATRATWQRTHVFAEAQRRLRDTGMYDPALADRLTAAALSEPHSTELTVDPGAELGEPTVLTRRDGTSVYRTHNARTYTNAEVVAAEHRIVASAHRRDGWKVSETDVELALLEQSANRCELNAGQQSLVRAMAGSGQRVMLGLAPAGAGKTTAMAALARAWEQSGGTVIGLSPSANAAQLLRKEIDVEVADTVDKFTWLHNNPDHGAHDAARAWFDSIDETTLLIIDEAGKAGTLALDNVIAVALARGASVRLIGDDRQLASISAGGVLRDLAETTETVTLSQIMRFACAAEAQAGAALRVGDPAGLAFYADHGRIHVGAEATASDMALHAWITDYDDGRDSLLLAPTNDMATTLNAAARLHRLTTALARGQAADSPLEAPLADGLRASVGDIIVTKDNNRRLRVGASDFVRNGYRWEVTAVTGDGAVVATHLDSGQHLKLPGDYVRSSVRLGYAATIDSAQGATARHRCHTVGHDSLTRQQVYTALSRGVRENHIYLSTAETDPHRILAPKATHPETAIDVLTRALARDNTQISATTLSRHATDPTRHLAANTLRYTDAVGAAAESLLTAEQSRALDTNADRIHPGLTSCQAWPVLRKHLARIAATGRNPLKRLAAAVQRADLSNASDAAAVLDWRLDPSGAHSGGAGPLPWLPAIPDHPDTKWTDYLRARADLITEQAETIRAESATWTPATAPRWARPLIGADTDLLAELAVFRAAFDISADDTRIAGPDLYADRARATQSRLRRAAAAIIGHPDRDTARWNSVVDHIDTHIRRDPYWPHLATELVRASRTGVDIRQLITTAAAQGPLPDELPAAALWWRICGALSPAAVETTRPGLRPDVSAPDPRTSAIDLPDALASVTALRTRYLDAQVEYTQLRRADAIFNGPNVQRVMPHVVELRARADADRPYLSAVQEVLARWSDADADYERAVLAAQQARDYHNALQTADDTTPDDLAAARRHLEWTQTRLPEQAPAEAFWSELKAAETARAAAAGGPDKLVTHADADAVLDKAHRADDTLLRQKQTQLHTLRAELDRAETAAGRAFARAQLRSADHITEQLDTIAIELRVLETAGDWIQQRPLAVDATTLDDDLAGRLDRLARTPFAVTPVTATDRTGLITAMTALHTTAAAAGRDIHWWSTTEHDPAVDATLADHTANLNGAAAELPSIPTNSIIVIDHAQHADPATLADLAAAAAAANSRVILLNTAETTWPPPPSQALLRLLDADLPWSLTLTTAPIGARTQWRPAGADLQPALTQASTLAPELRTPAITDALTRRDQMRTQHRTAWTVGAKILSLANEQVGERARGREGHARGL